MDIEERCNKALSKLKFIFDTFYETALDESHDSNHAREVAMNAISIFNLELGDSNPIILDSNYDKYSLLILYTAVFHDAYDHKYIKDSNTILKIKQEIIQLVSKDDILQKDLDQNLDIIFDVIDNMSYSKEIANKKNGIIHKPLSKIVFDIVQDADRVEAIGEIGVKRNYLYTLYKVFNGVATEEQIHEKMIEHMHEKLKLLWPLLNTESAKKLFEDRHKYTLSYLEKLEKIYNLT